MEKLILSPRPLFDVCWIITAGGKLLVLLFGLQMGIKIMYCFSLVMPCRIANVFQSCNAMPYRIAKCVSV